MIGRKQRTHIVFIDGIPIESATLNAGESGVQKEDPSLNPSALKELEPRALFDKYDADGSGGIDLDEFKVLLKDLGINLSEPKAVAYFKRCDKMRRGHISFEEFRLALYTCDSKNQSRTTGFAPGQALSPKDLFEMYDREEQGAIDRATFIEILEFLGHNLPLDQVEYLFATHEDPDLEMLPYYQFKKVWLGLVDARTELRNRHEKFNRLLTHTALMKKLEMVINKEEKEEAKVLLEAATTLDEERIATYRRWLVDESVALSKVVLAEAIDAAGQVYLFGKGPFGRFDGEPIEPDFIEFMDYEVVRDLWKARVHPNAEALAHDLKLLGQIGAPSGESSDNGESDDDSSENVGPASSPNASHKTVANKNTSQQVLTRAKMTLISAARAFSGRQVSLVPAFLWGKRIRKVALGPAVAYALTDSGEVFCWGANKRKWRYFYDSATLDASQPHLRDNKMTSESPQADVINNDVTDRPMTTRTEILKQTLPYQVEQNQEEHDQFYLRRKYQNTFVKPVRPLPTDDQNRRKLHLLGQYFDLLPPDESPANLQTTATPKLAKPDRQKNSKQKTSTPANMMQGIKENLATEDVDSAIATSAKSTAAAQPRTLPSYQVLLETVEPDLNVDDLVVALELRGVHLAKQTRMDLVQKLGNCLELELECLGPKFHAHMKEQDKAARRAKHDRREKALRNILVKSTVLWNELRILQEDIVRIERDGFSKSEHEYLEMKKRIAHAKQKIKRQAREGFLPDESILYISGLTSRGAPQRLFNGDQALMDISVGSRHALAVHQTGKVFTWGVGTFGRLGGVRFDRNVSGSKSPAMNQTIGDDDIDAWHRDIHSPQCVSSLDGIRFREVCCGYSHSLALTTQGEVYVWGSATHGKLGIGAVSSNVPESFTLTPLLLHLPGRSTIRVRKIACGPSHSALLTTDGSLFVWGAGDGGKLGLGDGRDVGDDRVPRNGGQLGVVEAPVRVNALKAENCIEVSCGTAHTVVLTAVSTNVAGCTVAGGRVYVAGSNHALGKFTPTFTALRIPRVEESSSSEQGAHSSVVITRVSCGNAHTGLVSYDGELLTWGNNAGGCTGHPIVQPLLKTPTRVSCLYLYPRNLCLDKGVKAYQSTQNASCAAEFALETSTDPLSSPTFSQTQQEMCPFWQVKLLTMSRIEQIVVTFHRATTSSTTPSRPTQRALDPSSHISSRPMSASSTASTNRTSRPSAPSAPMGVKYVALISEAEFDLEERGKYSLAKSKGHSIFSAFTLEREGTVHWVWDVPVDTYGQFVRIQMENTVGMLSLANVTVNGTRADEYNGPRVGDVACSEGVTVAICRPLSSSAMVRERFQRAVRADRNNLWILKQMETFHEFVLEELEVKSDEDKNDVKSKCPLCRPKERCVICLLDDAAFASEIEKDLARQRKEREDQHRAQLEQERQRQDEMLRMQKELMRGGRSIVQNKGKESERRKAARDAKAKAEAIAKVKKTRGGSEDEDSVEILKRSLTLEEKCQKLLTMNMRTEEEEEEAEQRLAAELFAIDPVAALAAQAENEKQNSGAAILSAGTPLAAKLPKPLSIFGRISSLFTSKQRSTAVDATLAPEKE